MSGGAKGQCGRALLCDLAVVTAKMLGRLLKGTDAEAAVPLLLAARDAHLAAEVGLGRFVALYYRPCTSYQIH